MHRQFPALAVAVLALTATAGFSQTPPEDSKQNAKAGDSTPDPFAMDLDSLSNTKVTTASKFSEKLSDAPSVMAVVSQDELKRFGGMTLSEILNRVAGLNISSGFFQDRSTIAVEGDQSRVNSGHVLFLINGRPVREIMEGGISSDLLESFPVGILERIEVIKGPGSVLYGSDAFSGVINLITKKAVGTSVDISSSGGPGGAEANSAELFFDRGGVNVVAAGQYHQMPIWDTKMGFLPGTINPESIQNASLRDDGEGAYLGITYKGLRFTSAYTGLEEASFAGALGDTRWKRGFADLGYDLKASNKWEMSFDFTYARNTLDDPYFPLVHRDSYSALFEWTNFYTFSEKDRITFGTLFEHIAGTELLLINPPIVDAQGNREQGGFYAQYEHKLTDDVKLIAGFQANKIGAIALNVVPRGGIIWNPSPHVTLKALYGGAFRAPSLDETLLNGPLKGNPNLVPETVGTLDIQTSYQSNRTQLAIAYFHSRQDHVIFQDESPSLTYANLTTPATYQGIDSEGKYYLNKGWFLMGGALYQTNHDSTIKSLSPIPSFSAGAGLSYQAGKTADIGIFDAYQGHIPGYSASLNPRPDAFHSVNAHLRFDLTNRWIKNDKRSIAALFYGDNLTNTPVWLPQWGSGGPNTMPVNRGRTLFLGIEIRQKSE